MIRALRALPCLLSLAACGDDATKPLADVSVLADQVPVMDAALSPDGDVGFFAGLAGAVPVVARIQADGTAVDLLRGAPLQSARGLVALDRTTVYVADEVGDVVRKIGAGAPEVIAATMGTAPRAVELDAADTLYWVGKDGGAAAVFKLTGGARTVVAKDARFTELGGIDVADDGTVYVTDDAGAVFKIAGGVVAVLADGVLVGDPAGLALAPGDATVLVSSFDATGHSQVLLIDTATGAQSTFNDTIRVNTASGGLHRAQDAATEFIWADLSAGGAGTVYRVRLN